MSKWKSVVQKVAGSKLPSNYQMDFFSALAGSGDNLILNAAPGSGKTTTIEWGFFTLGTADVCITAFNKEIALEMERRFKSHGCSPTIKTLNAIGHAAILKQNRKAKFNANKLTELCSKLEIEEEWQTPAIAIVHLFKGLGIGILTDFPNWKEANKMISEYDIDGLDDDSPMFWQAVSSLFHNSLERMETFDFSDQLAAPIYHDMELPRYSVVMIDESQDLNNIQIEMISRMAINRVVFVGDPNQAIYGFRGANVKAMENIQERFNAKNMPLSICYRCSKSVVRAAQLIVPSIEYHENAPEGTFSSIGYGDFFDAIRPKDFVLCRTIAPLVKNAIKSILKGKKAICRGKDIGKSLIWTLKGIKEKYKGSIPSCIKQWADHAYCTWARYPQQIMLVDDKMNCMLELAEGCSTYEEIYKRIQDLFSDDLDKYIVFSTIHRAKGLETNVVYGLHPELLPHPKAVSANALQQEINLKLVAITRARHDFFWVNQ